MKNVLFIIGLLIGTLLFASENETDGSRTATAAAQETVMKEKNPASDIHYRIEALGNELKENNCLTPRRVLPTPINAFQVRLQNTFTKVLQALRLKTQDAGYKISEDVSLGQTIHLSTLFCCKGHHVFALRKLIICF